MAWTTTDLLTSIKNRAMFPDASSGSLSPEALLSFATEELFITIVPMILSVREKYYETYQDTTVTTATTSIPIPARAIGGTLSSVQYIINGSVKALQPIDPATISTTQTSADPSCLYFQNNSIVLYPPPGANIQGVIRQRYFQRPNRLAQTSSCAQITAIDAVGFTVTVSVAPSTWTVGTTVDFIPQTASQATPYALDQAITNVATNVISFASLPTGLAVGDWLALAEYTPIPEVPFEFQTVLAQATACKGLEASGDQAGLAAASAKLAVYQKAAVLMLTPRDQAGSKKLVSPWRSY